MSDGVDLTGPTPTRIEWRLDGSVLFGVEKPAELEHYVRAAGRYIFDDGEWRDARRIAIELPDDVDQAMTLRFDVAAGKQRFTEKGAECRLTHVNGYTGPICSCPPLACFAVERTEEPSE